MPPPVLISSGRSADVFALDEQRVLRRYRDGNEVSAEVPVMTYVAALGFPVPRIYEAKGTDLVMERVAAPTMLQALLSRRIRPEIGAALLLSLHRQLHGLPPRLSSDPDARVLHLDLHPGNVILSPGGPVVIDWRNSAEGPPDLDLAVSALILAQVAADEAHEMAALAGVVLMAFLRFAGGSPLRMLDRAMAMRRSDPALTADETSRLASAVDLIRRCPDGREARPERP
ncbi:MAG TPA: phosphotransferase [Streptosporangiaceae bacterium]|nr:phosphotransferase [Streptosporangiaceae bacterium]